MLDWARRVEAPVVGIYKRQLVDGYKVRKALTVYPP